jgi:hypothetical protein
VVPHIIYFLKGEVMSESIIEAKIPGNKCVTSSDDINSNTYISLKQVTSSEDHYDLSLNIHPDHFKALEIQAFKMWWVTFEWPNDHENFDDVVVTLSEHPGKLKYDSGRGLEYLSTGWGRWRKTFSKHELEHSLMLDCSKKVIIMNVEKVTNNDNNKIMVLRPQRCSHSNDCPTISGSADVGIESGNMPDDCKANTDELVIVVDDEDIADS